MKKRSKAELHRLAFKPTSYGYITLRNRSRKVSRAHNRATNTARGEITRKVRVNVFLRRGVSPTNTSEGAGYWAWACTSKHADSGSRREVSSLARHRENACGEDAHGRTPTAAIKKALINLGRKKSLR